MWYSHREVGVMVRHKYLSPFAHRQFYPIRHMRGTWLTIQPLWEIWLRWRLAKERNIFCPITNLSSTYVILNPLDAATLKLILTEPKNALIKQYEYLFELDGVKLKVENDALDFIVDKAVEFKLGARGLRSICEAIMVDAMFDIPHDENQVKEFTLTVKYAKEKLEKSKFSKLKVA